MTFYSVPRLFFFWHRAITLWWPWRAAPRIYIPRSRAPEYIPATLAHESVHVAQWTRLGRVGFLRLYLTKRGRTELEAEAYAASVRYWRAVGVTLDTEGVPMADAYARAMSEEYGGLSEVEARAAIARFLA